MVGRYDNHTNAAPIPVTYGEVAELRRRVADRRRRWTQLHYALAVFFFSAAFWVPFTVIGLFLMLR